MKKIFITGGTGFIGKSILSIMDKQFINKYHLTILTRNPQKFIKQNFNILKNNVQFVKGDILNTNWHYYNLPCYFDYLIHAGNPAEILPKGEISQIIEKGTENIINFSKQYHISKILYISSGAVYGKLDTIQNTKLQPKTEYGMSKMKAQKMLIDSNINTVIARCFSFVGKYLPRKKHYAIGNFIQDCIDGKNIYIKGNYLTERSYMYSDDLVQWLFTILEKGKNGQAYNVGSPYNINMVDLAKTITNVIPNSKNIQINSKNKELPTFYYPNIDKSKQQLNLNIKVNLQDAIRKTIAE